MNSSKQPDALQNSVRIQKIARPNEGLTASVFQRVDYSDSYKAYYFNYPTYTIEMIAQLYFNSSPNWARKLLSIRNKIVGWTGLITRESIVKERTNIQLNVGQRVGLFTLYARSDDEIIFGEDDKHLNVRMALKSKDQTITVSTFIQYKNTWGRLYFNTISLAHKFIAKSTLKRMIKRINQGSLELSQR